MIRRIRLFWFVLGTTIAVAGCSPDAGTATPSASQPTATVGSGGAGANLKSDEDFVPDVAMKTMAAIEVSRLALERSATPDIKSLAQLIIGGQTVAGDKLKGIVAAGPAGWPGQLDEKHRKTLDELTKKPGTDFDREYLASMVEVHEDLAAKLESRLDVQSLADWKTAAASRTQSGSVPGSTPDAPIRPGKSDRDLTGKINQWAAETYPVAQNLLAAARTLETAAKKKDSTK